MPGRFDLSKPENQRKLDAADALAQLADELGVPLPQLAIAFVLRHPAVTAPIVGPRTMEQLEGVLGADAIELTPEERARLEEPAPPPDVYPHRMLSEQSGLPVVTGPLRRPD